MNNLIVSIALFGWIPAVLLLFLCLSPLRAVIASFLVAWLFLPMAGLKLAEGIPLYDKMLATCLGVMMGVIIFDLKRFVAFRPTLHDLPMLVWCLCPIASSLSNDLGTYDGLAEAFRQTVAWGLPYFIGRLYFKDAASIRELAIGLFIGGLLYVPLCLFEIRMSPQLHGWVYGFQQHSFAQTIRWGGWRPVVFMQHGLMVGMWMCMTAFIGFWLWRGQVIVRSWQGVPLAWIVAALILTAILCKSTGAIILLGLGLGALWLGVRLNTRSLVYCLILAAPLYSAVRASGLWDGTFLLSAASEAAGQDRSESLEFRLNNENMLAAKAMDRPLLGWGGWGRGRVTNDDGKDIAVTDGLWIIAFGDNGIVGLGSLTLAMLLPVTILFTRYRPRTWLESDLAPTIVLGAVIVLYWIDCVPNGMVNPIFTLAVGGITGFVAAKRHSCAHIGTISAPPPYPEIAVEEIPLFRS